MSGKVDIAPLVPSLSILTTSLRLLLLLLKMTTTSKENYSFFLQKKKEKLYFFKQVHMACLFSQAWQKSHEPTTTTTREANDTLQQRGVEKALAIRAAAIKLSSNLDSELQLTNVDMKARERKAQTYLHTMLLSRDNPQTPNMLNKLFLANLHGHNQQQQQQKRAGGEEAVHYCHYVFTLQSMFNALVFDTDDMEKPTADHYHNLDLLTSQEYAYFPFTGEEDLFHWCYADLHGYDNLFATYAALEHETRRRVRIVFVMDVIISETTEMLSVMGVCTDEHSDFCDIPLLERYGDGKTLYKASEIMCAECYHVVPHANDLKMCSRCKMVRYCSSQCQAKHWNVHRSECHTSLSSM